MHPSSVRYEALALIATGLNDCEVARRLDLPRTTVRDWRRPTYTPKTGAGICPRCWRAARRRIVFTDADYAELLGLYLGDGHIVRTGRSDRFRLFLDTRYSQIISDAHALLERCFPDASVGVGRSAKGTTTIISLYGTHLACLFPQHAPGRKHERSIELEGWQRGIIDRQPWPFLRGLIRSDGCVFVNRTGPYEYVSYDFTNHSADILRLFADVCDLVGVEYRAYRKRVRIYRRASVALMLQHVGLKA
jgi:Homeodomain-like domain-containing protein/LAGLIDADG DNA endonuclease family protein